MLTVNPLSKHRRMENLNYIKKKALFGMVLFLSMAVHAQSDFPTDSVQDSRWKTFKYDFGNILGGIGHAYTRPLSWKGKDFSRAAATTLATLALFTVDDEIQDWKNGFAGDVPDFVKDYGNNFANPSNNYLFTGGVYLTGLFAKSPKWRRTGVLMISSATAGGFLQQVVKRIVGRARPRSGDNSDVFDPLNLNRVFNYDSFFSGHTVLAFTNAYALAKNFDNPWVKSGIYFIGGIPGVVRIIDDFHWTSDVFFGTIVSIAIVESIDKYLDSKYGERSLQRKKKISWNLNVRPNGIGITGNF